MSSPFTHRVDPRVTRPTLILSSPSGVPLPSVRTVLGTLARLSGGMSLGLGLALVAQGAWAQTAGSASGVRPPPALAPVVVTATRTARTTDDSLASVTVLTREDIEREQVRSLPDLIRGLAGVSLSNSGGPGKLTSIYLRGTNPGHVLILVDGVRLGSATAGIAAVQDLPVELIDRIEVVRGPRSSLYGSDAVGGVIQIFTRRGQGPLQPSLSVQAGSNRTAAASLGFAGGSDDSWFSAQVSHLHTRGFDACRGQPFPDGAGCFTIEPDRDGARNLSGSVRAGRRLANGVETELQWLRTDGRNAFDGSFVNEGRTVQQAIGLAARTSLTDRLQAKLALGQSRDETGNFLNGDFQSRFDTRRDQASMQFDWSASDAHLISLGLDWANDTVDSDVSYTVASRRNHGLYLQSLSTLGRDDLQLSLRHDDNAQFGRQSTGGIGWGRDLASSLRLTAHAGTAFRAPTFNDLYYPGFSNPTLRPETAQSLELGLSGRQGVSRWSLNVFQTRISQLIVYDAAIFAPNNLEDARIRGLELATHTSLGGWLLGAQGTLLDSENRSEGANLGKELPRRARQGLRLDADRTLAGWRWGATLRLESSRFDDVANTRSLPGYGTMDLRAERRLNQHWRLQARVENLLDRDYETVAFFRQPGRSAYLTLRYSP